MSTFKVGNIVSLKSHPYNSVTTDVLISGEATLIPPLMVITEVANEVKDSFDEKTGAELTRKGTSQCKCTWYSHQSAQYEEAWVHSSLLKHIDESTNLTRTDIQVGSIVTLKSLPQELGKKKSSLKIERNSNSGNYDRTATTSLLSFVGPVMQVIQVLETKTNESKESLYDIKTGTQKRFLSSWNIKCKWFNPAQNKMSEKFLPIESLRLIEEVPSDAFKHITTMIAGNKILRDAGEENPRIMKPEQTIYRCRKYLVGGFDYINNSNIEIPLLEVSGLDNLDSYFNESGPQFDLEEQAPIIEQIQQIIQNAIDNHNYIRIKYKNKNDKLSVRTIDNFTLNSVTNELDEEIQYLDGYCNLRKENRRFRLNRIQWIERLDVQYQQKTIA